jgi:hypothetical protein
MCPGAAIASQAYIFVKKGVSRQAYVADVSECSELAGGVNYRAHSAGSTSVYVRYPNTSAGVAGTALGLILVAALAENPARRTAEIVERTCMADKGYGRAEVQHSFRKAIESERDASAREERFFAFASTDHPGVRMLEE